MRGSTLQVSVRGISKSFGSVRAIDGVSFEARPGSFVTLLGPSGSGKTTILRCIAGVETPDRGMIMIGDRVLFDSTSGTNLQPQDRGVGMVYQSYALWPHMTVAENVAYPLRVRRDTDMVKKVNSVLELLGIKNLAQRHPYEISGGEQQRVAIARAIVYDPAVVLFDEPFSSLDARLRETLRDELKRLQRKTGLTMIYVTHDQVDALSLSDELVILNGGRVAAIGRPAELLASPPNSYTARFLSGMLVLDGEIMESLGGTLQVQTKAGILSVRSEANRRKGDRVKVCVRPGGATLASGSVSGGLAATVTGLVRRPTGEVSVRVETESGTTEIPEPVAMGAKFEVGEKIALMLDPSFCSVLDD
jgi:iron(III) transport system ATP-binding protein